MTRLLVQGASGRLGQTIVRLAQQSDTWQVTASEKGASLEPLVAITEVGIDVSVPEASVQMASLCARYRKPLVIGTTGHSDAQQNDIDKAAASCPILVAPNFSVGVNIFFEINKRLAALMAPHPEYEVQVTEIHHTEKKDSPSGTAITLAEGILQKITRKKGWVNHISDNLDELEIISERVDPAPGTHSINYHSDIDTITITHTAHNRRGFATGAVLAAEFIAGKKGVYQMSDVLGF